MAENENETSTVTEETVEQVQATVEETPAVETSAEVVEEPKPAKKTRKSSKKAKEKTSVEAPVVEEGEKNEKTVMTEEQKAEEIAEEEDAASESSEELNIMDDAKTAEVPDDKTKSHLFLFRKGGILLGLDPVKEEEKKNENDNIGFISFIPMKKFRFGIIVNDAENIDYNDSYKRCMSFVKSALNKLNDPDIEVREMKIPEFIEAGKFYNVVSVHVPFHKNINIVIKEMHNTVSLLNNGNDENLCKFIVRDGNYADLIADASKMAGDEVVFKGFQCLTVSKTKNPNKPLKESLSAGIYASDALGFKQKDISYVNKANLNVMKMNQFGSTVKFDPISHHDVNFGKRFGVIVWNLSKKEDGFHLIRYTCEISLRDYKAFGKIYITDGVRTLIKEEDIPFGFELPKFETFFQTDYAGEKNCEILCTMLQSNREDPRWAMFDNDVDIIDECMLTGITVETTEE